MIALWVSAAGAVGATTRFTVDGLIRQRSTTQFPLATLIINITGSLLLGILTGLVLYHGASTDLKLIAGTGFCGGYTTFSTASFESVRLLQRRAYGSAALNLCGTAVLTMAAAVAGLGLAQL